jgi:hypothetical protein
MSTQPSAREFAGVDNKSKKNTAIGVFIFVFATPPDPSKRRIFHVLCSQTSGTRESVEASFIRFKLERSTSQQKASFQYRDEQEPVGPE